MGKGFNLNLMLFCFASQRMVNVGIGYFIYNEA